MPLRTSHSKPRPEVPRPAELPAGVAASEPPLEALPRPPYRKGSAAARQAGARGGRRKAGTTQLATGLGLAKTFADESFERYRTAAQNFARTHVQRLATLVGGGECGPGPSSIVWSAGLQLAASRWAFEVKGDAALGSRLADASRANLLAAHELCAREAEQKKNAPGAVPAWRQRIAEQMARDAEARGSSGSD